MSALFLSFSFVATLFAAEPPASYPKDRYNHLWIESLVTDQPQKGLKEPPANPLEGWVLIGSSRYTDSQEVTIINTKDSSQRVTIPGKEASELGLTIVQLKQDSSNFLRTEALIQKESHTAWLKYDPKFLRAKHRGKKAQPIPGLPSAKVRKARTQKNTGKKRQRVRYISKAKK